MTRPNDTHSKADRPSQNSHDHRTRDPGTRDPGTPVLGMVLKGFPRISETFISNEILLLEQRGVRVHIFSMRHPRESFTHKSVQQIRARVDYLPQAILEAPHRLAYHNALLALKYPRQYGHALRTAFKRFRRTRKSATLKHLLQAGYLVHKLLPGSGVVHLHAHFAHSPSSVAMFAALLSGLDFSFTAHAKDIYTSNALQLKEKIEDARFVVTCTEYNRTHLRNIASAGKTPIHRIYHGIDTSLFSNRNGSHIPQPPYRLLTIARLVPKKGLPTVYQALQRLAARGVDFQHILIGDGEDRDAILALIQRLGLSSRCRWQGTLPHEEVLTHFNRSDLFVLGCEQAPNGDRDGIPNVFIESMAMGVPVVGTTISAIPELITSEKTGILVPPKHPDAMADAILRLLTDKDLRTSIIAAAKRRVAADFDNQALIEMLVDVYRREQPALAQP
jgi:glycosyltransferase involved in cell wall biosynthesis